jgi:enamine deaminase RidA (YjgF/YER057c/UK114 family)
MSSGAPPTTDGEDQVKLETAAAEVKKQIVRPDAGIHPLPWPYSHGVRVGDPEAQARQAWRNIQTVIEAAGGKVTDVVRVTTYLADAGHVEALHTVRREFFPDGDFPTATVVEVAALALPGLLLETEAFAIIGCS